MQVKEDFLVPTGILSVFQIFGIFPLSLFDGDSRGVNLFLRFVALINCLLILGITFASFYFASDIFDATNAIGLFVDIIQILSPIIAHLVICAEAPLSIASYRQFWVHFQDTCHLLQQLHGPLKEELQRLYRRCQIKLGILFVVPLLIELRILYGISDNFWVYSRLAAEFAFIGCRLSYLNYCFHVELINWVLAQLEEHVRNLSNDSRSQLKRVEWEMKSGIAYRRLQVVQKATRISVTQLTTTLSTCYRWSLLANLTNNFLSITIAFYWNYRTLYFSNLMYQAESLMVGTPLLVILYYVMWTCENCFKPVTKIIYYVNRIARHPSNVPLHRLLQQYQLQLLSQRYSLTAMQFMDVDFRSLKDMIAAMATYLVIFIQFMPKDGNTAVNDAVVIQEK